MWFKDAIYIFYISDHIICQRPMTANILLKPAEKAAHPDTILRARSRPARTLNIAPQAAKAMT